ncbi:MAG: acyl carrier protein [Bacteriovoracaceae bacterium]|nr:acyl carrier protein [Bacteriovoracaceae bacterium]
MNSEELAAFLTSEFSKVCHKEVDPQDNLIEQGFLDSIGLVNLVVAIESKFNLKIPAEDIRESNFNSVESAKKYLERKIND